MFIDAFKKEMKENFQKENNYLDSILYVSFMSIYKELISVYLKSLQKNIKDNKHEQTFKIITEMNNARNHLFNNNYESFLNITLDNDIIFLFLLVFVRDELKSRNLFDKDLSDAIAFLHQEIEKKDFDDIITSFTDNRISF